MTLLADTLPQGSNDGYVAAAYIVFFAIVLIYVVIMAIRLGRVERKLGDLRAQQRDERDGTHTSGSGDDEPGRAREREQV